MQDATQRLTQLHVNVLHAKAAVADALYALAESARDGAMSLVPKDQGSNDAKHMGT
jgi:hypothetical protein